MLVCNMRCIKYFLGKVRGTSAKLRKQSMIHSVVTFKFWTTTTHSLKQGFCIFFTVGNAFGFRIKGMVEITGRGLGL